MDVLYVAKRGVCIGPERHLMPGDPPVALDKGTAAFLVSIGAVEEVPAPAPADPPAPPSAPAEVPIAAAKPAAAPAPAASEPAPAKPGKKEK